MNSERPTDPREQMEVRITALLLGEASAFEEAELLDTIKNDPGLEAYYEEMRGMVSIIEETIQSTPADPAVAGNERFQLDEKRRVKLRQLFRKSSKTTIPLAPGNRANRLSRTQQFLAVAAALVILFIAIGMFLPALSKAKFKASQLAFQSADASRSGAYGVGLGTSTTNRSEPADGERYLFRYGLTERAKTGDSSAPPQPVFGEPALVTSEPSRAAAKIFLPEQSSFRNGVATDNQPYFEPAPAGVPLDDNRVPPFGLVNDARQLVETLKEQEVQLGKRVAPATPYFSKDTVETEGLNSISDVEAPASRPPVGRRTLSGRQWSAEVPAAAMPPSTPDLSRGRLAESQPLLREELQRDNEVRLGRTPISSRSSGRLSQDNFADPSVATVAQTEKSVISAGLDAGRSAGSGGGFGGGGAGMNSGAVMLSDAIQTSSTASDSPFDVTAVAGANREVFDSTAPNGRSDVDVKSTWAENLGEVAQPTKGAADALPTPLPPSSYDRLAIADFELSETGARPASGALFNGDASAETSLGLPIAMESPSPASQQTVLKAKREASPPAPAPQAGVAISASPSPFKAPESRVPAVDKPAPAAFSRNELPPVALAAPTETASPRRTLSAAGLAEGREQMVNRSDRDTLPNSADANGESLSAEETPLLTPSVEARVLVRERFLEPAGQPVTETQVEAKLARIAPSQPDRGSSIQLGLTVVDQLKAGETPASDDKERQALQSQFASNVAVSNTSEELAKQTIEPVTRKAETPSLEPRPEVQTVDNAFSTFSLNVSDVSFKLAQASLENGQLPDGTQLRSEEFINAMDYHDPAPLPGQKLAFHWERARHPFAFDRDLLRFSIQTAAAGRQADQPLNLVVLLDNSGSMERSDRVEITHQMLAVLADQLNPNDRISVISFARTARLWVDGMPGGDPAELMRRIGRLNPEGGTNLEDAMRSGYEIAQKHYNNYANNRVILLTDGAANLGNVDPKSLQAKVVEQRQRGIALDCFGVGWEGYNDSLLETLSRNGDGRYGFINRPEQAGTEFANLLAGALQVAASDVKAQVEFNPDRVTSYRQIGYLQHQLTKEQFRDNTVDAAEIGAAEAGNALYVTQINKNGSGPIGTVRVRYRVPATGVYEEREWVLPYNPASTALEASSPAMKLAATSASFAEWLAQSPHAAEVTLGELQHLMNGVPESFAPDSRPQELQRMIQTTRSISGQ